MVAMTNDHPLVAKTCLTVAILANEPLIFYSESDADTRLYTILCRILGNEPNVAYRTSNTLSVLALAAAGLGLALVPATMMQVAIPGLVYKVLDAPELAADLMLISRGEESSGAVLAFLALARQEAAL